MKEKRFFIGAVAALTFLVSLCGCANVDGEVSTAPSSAVSQQTTEMISSITDGSLDELFSGGETSGAVGDNSVFPTKCKIYKQTKKQFSEEQLLSFFRSTPQKGENYVGDIIHYENDAEVGYITDGMFRYSTLAGGKYGSICNSSFLEYNNIEGYADGTLDFASRDEALEQVGAVLEEKFGIKRENWFGEKIYAVKKENVDFYKQSIFEEANQPETSANELELAKLKEQAEKLKTIPSEDYYYISLGFKLDDIPYYNGKGFFFGQDGGSIILNYTVYVVVTPNGIEAICLINVNETDVSSGTETELIGADAAWEIIREKYDGIILDSDVKIYDMQFVYLPIPQNDLENYFTNFELRPFYAFYCKETGNNESEYISYIDAVTGSELGTAPIWG